MPSNKLEKLKHLSPLAAAIAFSAAIPAQTNAASFTIDVQVGEGPTSQQQLDDAISVIAEGEGGGSSNHTITFNSAVTGTLYLNGFDIYDYGSVSIDASTTTGLVLIAEEQIDVSEGGSLTINGSGTEGEGLELVLREGEGLAWSSMNASDYGVLQIDNLALTIETNSSNSYSYNPTFNVFGYAEISMNNVTIDVVDEEGEGYFRIFEVAGGVNFTLDNVHVDAAYEAEGLQAERSNVTISNSSFTGMAYYDTGIEIFNGGGDIKYISITDTTFENNYSNGLLSIDGYSNSNLEVTLNNLVFENNESSSDLVSFDTEGESSLDLTLTNTVFVGNEIDGDLVGFSTEGESSINATLNSLVFDSNISDEDSLLSAVTRLDSNRDDMELTLTLTNSTFSGNEANRSIISLQTYGTESSFSSTESELNALIGNVTLVDNASGSGTLTAKANDSNTVTDLNLAMAHVTMVDNEAEGGSGYSGLNIYRSNGNNNDVNVAIINSIISGNSGLEEGDEIDTDIYSSIEIDIDNSLIGANPDADAEEGEGIINGSNNIFGVDPMLNELADNGGSTFTMLPKAGSPVIDAGDADFADQLDVDLSLVFDQREEERLRGAAPDMGAVEVVPVDEAPTKKKKADGLFGSVGFGSLMAMFALVGLRRKRK